MNIKLRGKTWKQVTEKEFIQTKEDVATFSDYKYHELTFFKLVKSTAKTDSKDGVKNGD